MLHKIDFLIRRIERYILTFLISCMVVLAMLQVISRFVIESPIPWTEAMLTYMFVWTVFLGASLAVAENAHFGVELLVVHFSDKVQRIIATVVNVLMIAFAWMLLSKGILLVEGNTTQMMSAMPFSMVWPYLAMPVSGLLIIVHVLNNTLCLWRD